MGADRRERETIVQMKQQFANFIHVQADISDEDGRRHILKAAEAGKNVVKALVNAGWSCSQKPLRHFGDDRRKL